MHDGIIAQFRRLADEERESKEGGERNTLMALVCLDEEGIWSRVPHQAPYVST